MKKLIPFLFTLLSSVLVFSQTNLNSDALKERDLKTLKAVQNKYNNFNNRFEKNVYNQHFTRIENDLNKNYKKNFFILDNDYQEFIKNCFQNIKDANKTIPLESPHFYILKSNVPNASSLGFDYYMINNGLFQLFDNEYQFAAVITHEIAHNYLQHVKLEIIQEAEFIQDFKKEYRSLKRSDLIKLIKSQDEVIQKKYDLANQSRKKEIAADSLGFILYSQLNFPKIEYLNSLKKLEEFDEKIKTTTINDSLYYQTFEVNGVKLNPKWLKIQKNELFSGLSFTEHVNQDSVSTHPNIVDRINWLKNNFKIEEKQLESKNASTNYIQLKKKYNDTLFDNYYDNNEYAVALYHLIREKNLNSKLLDFDKNIAIIFNKLHEGRLKLSFNKYVPIADVNSEKTDYNKFLHLIWNIPTADLKTIADYYKTKATI
ncbi:Peptidase family M48 [Chishuiella changwenlii]|uniref:Peptidase family M48 n=1 Tax=Chishuiella changwenlii TaxID=1434701 RepID=A0A1M6XME9_9FLAO|nr:M48 family metalloprotease [Chishuiella changwenlii]GGF01338.1 hypothetical protein GCM10010984_18530 [Chishuiella changwenlii]SHL07131.1 Peptidase family M48 [Chishuiella changwenlii]